MNSDELGQKQTRLAYEVADAIDTYCEACASFGRKKQQVPQNAFRLLVTRELNRLEKLFNDRTALQVIAAYGQTCDDCAEKGGTGQVLESRYTCGLRTGILERPKRTYRKKVK